MELIVHDNNEQARDEYYSTKSARLNTIIGDNSEVWDKIAVCHGDWINDNLEVLKEERQEQFKTWLLKKYGILIKYSDGMVNLNIDIVDESLFTIFLLKY